MTKTEAARRTRAHLRFGYYHDGGTRAHVRCPECDQAVRVEYLAWEKPTPFLRAALITHLTEDH